MSSAQDPDNEQGQLMLSIGHCIMQWAAVELQLVLLFHICFQQDYEVADILWGRIRSFEAKLAMVSDLVVHRTTNEHQLRDWRLLRQHTTALYSKRNQVAHSTPIVPENGGCVLQPFSVVSKPDAPVLRKAQVDAFAFEFAALTAAIRDFTVAGEPASPHPEPTEQGGDLLRRLRTEDDRKRAEQRHRAQAWRQYLDLHPDLES